ncbi:hypothetical protein DA482_23255 [Pseudomonas fluorescens]|nr:hypothetical protein FIP59_00215 [Pseudomonas fluorescens]
MGAGVPAIQATRSFSKTEVRLSQASQLPHLDQCQLHFSVIPGVSVAGTTRLGVSRDATGYAQ